MHTRTITNLKPHDWFNTKLPKPFAKINAYNPKDKMLQWLGRFTSHYYSPLCPVFTSQIQEISDINDYEVVTIRDGLVPLLWFFRRIQSPENICPQLLVHKSLEAYIPSKWQEKINFFDITSSIEFTKTKRKKLLITGLLADQFSTKEQIDSTIRNLKDFLSRHGLNNLQVEVFFPMLFDPFYLDEPSHINVFHFTQQLISTFGQIDYSWQPKDFYKNNNFDDYYFLELNSSLLYQDSSISQQIMRRNGYNIVPPSSPSSSIDLSPFHQINIYFNKTKNQSSPMLGDCLIKDFDELFTSSTNDSPLDLSMPEPTNLNFPNIFYKFIRTNYKRR